MSTATVQVKEKPIIFSGPMVRAIIEGRKTQTRRIVKPQPDVEWMQTSDNQGHSWNSKSAKHNLVNGEHWLSIPGASTGPFRCSYGKVEDRLWVRETWCESYYGDPIVYKADGGESPGPKGFWRSPIHMQRTASRLTLEITNVRVERLQEISVDDVQAEGIGANWWPESNMLAQWQQGWDAINEKRGYSWESNPWVWVLEFRRML